MKITTNYLVAQLIGAHQSKGGDSGVIVGGCGMDMGFHIVYNLGRALWPDGFGCIGEKCHSNNHSNGDRDYTPHGSAMACSQDVETCHCLPREHWHGECDCKYEHWHTDGGYALRHRWL